MLALARLIDPAAREVRETYQQQVDEPLRQAYGKIAQARFALAGKQIYPDATFTLRLAFGVVRGYREDGSRTAALDDDRRSLRACQAARQCARRSCCPKVGSRPKIGSTWPMPFNFVSTADIIGGNSGSPVVNRAGEFVGIIFDGNLQSLVLDFVYTDEQSRALAVHSSAILESLRKVYHADRLADELRPPATGKTVGGQTTAGQAIDGHRG